MSLKPVEIRKKPYEYAEELLSAVLATVPFTGGLGVYLDKYFPSYFRETIENLKACLIAHSDDLESINCNLDHLGALISRLPVEYVASYSKAKRLALVNVIVNFSRGALPDAAEADVFMSIATALTEHQIIILQLLAAEGTRHPHASERIGARIALCNDLFPALSRPAILYLCTDLRQKGLLQPFEDNLDAPDSPIYISYLNLTDFGMSFLKWISPPIDPNGASAAPSNGG